MHNTKNKIAKRLKIIKGWALGMIDEEPHPWEMEPHRVHKFNLNCGCKMCHYYKYLGNSKGRFTYKEEASRALFLQEKRKVFNQERNEEQVPLSKTEL